jgi:hypothetical protein
VGTGSPPDDLGNGRTLTGGNENSNYSYRACGGNLCFCILYDAVGGSVKVGDLVIRRVLNVPDWKLKVAVNQRELLGHGVVLTKQMAGTPRHPCVTVYYPKAGKMYDIAESLLEVISGS